MLTDMQDKGSPVGSGRIFRNQGTAAKVQIIHRFANVILKLSLSTPNVLLEAGNGLPIVWTLRPAWNSYWQRSLHYNDSS